MTLSQALAAKVRLIVWCKSCQHRAEPDIADQVASYGPDVSVIDWAGRLRCSACGERKVDFVVSGGDALEPSPRAGRGGNFPAGGKVRPLPPPI